MSDTEESTWATNSTGKIEQGAYEIWEKIKQRAYEIWEREGLVHGDHERHWHTAKAEIEREISSSDILTVEYLAMRSGIPETIT